jgi:hypothetical protein
VGRRPVKAGLPAPGHMAAWNMGAGNVAMTCGRSRLLCCSGLLAVLAIYSAEAPSRRAPPVKPGAVQAEVNPVQPPSNTPEPRSEENAEAADQSGCIARLPAVGLVAEAVGTPPSTNEACTIDLPVRLKSLAVQGNQRPIAFPDTPIVACVFAERFGKWLGELAQPLVVAGLNTPIRAVRTGPGFECRNRNRAAAGKLSAHAVGIAVDVAAFELADGSTLSVVEGADKRRMAVLATLRTAACGWFTTILGPGTDPYHATHWHLDIQQHGSSDRYRICQ